MKPEDKDRAMDGINQAKTIAGELGIAITELTDNPKVAIYSLAISYATFCAIHDVSEHQAIDLFMSIYRQVNQGAGNEAH